MSLTDSYVKGPAEPVVREISIGQALAEVAAECPEKLGLIAGVSDPAARRQWTYA